MINTLIDFKKLSEIEQKELLNTIYELYVNQLTSINIISQKINYSVKTIRKLLTQLNVNQIEIGKKIIKKTKLEKYGNKNYVNSEKAKQTKFERYGSETYVNPEKTKQTNLKKYGVSTGWQSLTWKQNMNNKYGSIYALQNKECLNKMKQTRFNKYGCQFDKDKVQQTNLEKYNVNWYVETEECRKANGNTISNINKKICAYFNYDMSFLEHKGFDILDELNKIAIEINPTYTHNSTFGPTFNGKQLLPKNKNYHFEKSLKAINLNFHCIHIWDWDDIEKIKNTFFIKKEKISGHKCEIREITKFTANNFLNKYHLQNSCKGNDINIGLYYKEELVSCMTFGKSRYNKNYEYEFLRYATNKIIRGGIDKLWKYFINKHQPSSIISYCDNSKFEGKFFKHLNFNLKSHGFPTCHWYNMKTKIHITDNLLRQLGADKLLGTSYGKPETCGLTNFEIMIKEGFVEVYDCGQSVWEWKKD